MPDQQLQEWEDELLMPPPELPVQEMPETTVEELAECVINDCVALANSEIDPERCELHAGMSTCAADGCHVIVRWSVLCGTDHVACAHCGSVIDRWSDPTHYTIYSDRICENCADNGDHFLCHGCGRYTMDAWQCGDCSDDSDDDDSDDYGDSEGIHSYSYKPSPRFRAMPDEQTQLFFGIELEAEYPDRRGNIDRIAAMVNSEMSKVDDYQLSYLKQDGSLSHGFETVTHPMSYRFAMARFPWHVLDEMHEQGMRARDTCGIHIHVSRDGFKSPAHILRWTKFIYRNQPYVETLAGRSGNSYATFNETERRKQKYACKGGSAYSDAQRDGVHLSYERYSALNFQNDHTIEMRMFRSSLRPRKVRAYVAFAAASVEYAGQLTSAKVAKSNGWEWSAFTDWLDGRDEYEPLTAYLAEIAPKLALIVPLSDYPKWSPPQPWRPTPEIIDEYAVLSNAGHSFTRDRAEGFCEVCYSVRCRYALDDHPPRMIVNTVATRAAQLREAVERQRQERRERLRHLSRIYDERWTDFRQLLDLPSYRYEPTAEELRDNPEHPINRHRYTYGAYVDWLPDPARLERERDEIDRRMAASNTGEHDS